MINIFTADQIVAMMPRNTKYSVDEIISDDIMPEIVKSAAYDKDECLIRLQYDLKHNHHIPVDDIIDRLKDLGFLVEPLYFGSSTIESIMIKWRKNKGKS